jgi:DnaJ-class molecular chaperone
MRAVLIVFTIIGCGLAYSQETKPARKELSEETKAKRELRQHETKLDKWIKDVKCKKCSGSGSELASGTATESLGQFPTGAPRRGQYSYSYNRNCSRCAGSGVLGGCDESQRGLELWIDFLQM